MSSSDKKNRLDKNTFKIMSFEEADNYVRNCKNYSWQERLEIALYLTRIAYNFDMNNIPGLDRTVFEMKKRS